MTTHEKSFQIFIADNWNYHESSRVPVASFDTLAEAIAECQSRVDADLRGLRTPDMDPRALFDTYTTYGEDPWILGEKLNDPVPFSAWDYARERCKEICREGEVR